MRISTRIETRRDERTGVDIPERVIEFDDDTPQRETIWGAATGLHVSLLNNGERLEVAGDLNSRRVKA